MKEFMFYIRNEKDAKKSLTPDEHMAFIKKCEIYIGIMKSGDIEEAIKIAKDNPEFEYVPSASIEVRPVKTQETETGFVYPAKDNVTDQYLK